MSRFAALALLVWAAAGARFGVEALVPEPATPQMPRAPLAGFPRVVLADGWGTGDDVLIPASTLESSGVADYVHRLYTSGGGSHLLYVGYFAGATGAADHHPGICFPAHGLVLVGSERLQVPVPGLAAPVPVVENRWRTPEGHMLYSVSTFYYDSEFSAERWGLFAAGRLARIGYYAVITLIGDAPSTAGTSPAADGIRRKYTKALSRSIQELGAFLPNRPRLDETTAKTEASGGA